MGSVKVDINKDERRLEDEFRLSSPSGVRSFLQRRHNVEAIASSGVLAAVDMLVDVDAALDDADLSDTERDVVDLVGRGAWTIEEVAGIRGTTEWAIEAKLTNACEKIAAYLAKEGYGDEA